MILLHPPTLPHASKEVSVVEARSLYGMNGFRAMDPDWVRRTSYRDALTRLNPALFRMHHAGMSGPSTTPEGWWDEGAKRWDRKKIASSLGALPLKSARLIINIPSFPGSDLRKDEHGLLVPEDEPKFAMRMADLVRLLNKDLKLRVPMWEVTNELDVAAYVDRRSNGGWGDLKNPADLDDGPERLGRLYAMCARQMRKVDPSIRIGGPAAARVDLVAFAERFARAAGSELDFYSVHAYASGSKDDADEAIFARALGFGPAAKAMSVAVERGAGRSLPVYLDEYNISWTWETRDPRMTNAKSAIFDALAIYGGLSSGLAGMCAWNEMDGVYGKSEDDGRLRPSGRLFAWLNKYAGGPARTIVELPVGTVGWVTPGAVVIVRHATDPTTVNLSSFGKTSTVLTIGDKKEAIGLSSGGKMTLDGISVTLIARESAKK